MDNSGSYDASVKEALADMLSAGIVFVEEVLDAVSKRDQSARKRVPIVTLRQQTNPWPVAAQELAPWHQDRSKLDSWLMSIISLGLTGF